ncbi:hypothetical protein [Pseudoalteromonas sp. Scap03]|uniref:hypothetical protein n=1 Tax=Pseudoalteromonas sp. Scap03 TaxID=2585187 RepID=UPI0021168934|nr:hypothetical protein [Pseudoalteromonas sp. Scap03]
MRVFKIGLLITSVSVMIGAASLSSNTEQELSSANTCLHKDQTNAINHSANRFQIQRGFFLGAADRLSRSAQFITPRFPPGVWLY